MEMIDEERLQILIDKQDIYELICRYTSSPPPASTIEHVRW
jgi:hypothetical protein